MSKQIVIIGAGYTGLAAAFELTRAGYPVTILEADSEAGGLAGSFQVADTRLEKFYHHWFTNDLHVMELIRDLGCEADIQYRESSTGNYYANSIFRLSTPLDVLRYKPLSFLARIRLGLLVLQARLVRDWRTLESRTAAQWIRDLAGQEVFDKVWWPLLVGKFGRYAKDVSAVWFWKKLVLRGGSRGSGGKEVLAYYRGGFAKLTDKLVATVTAAGATIRYSQPATGLRVENNRVLAVQTPAGEVAADLVINTTALPLVADLVEPHVSNDYSESLRAIDYLGNVCLTLILNKSLSDTYWLNVTDPDFPYVGIIEHTNFESVGSYAGQHIVYLSKYLAVEDELFQMDDDEVYQFSLPYLQRMFPDFNESWVNDWHVYRAEYSQPIVGTHYSNLIPQRQTPLDNLLLCSMAQIYPEDRGTNYAIREGRALGKDLVTSLAEDAAGA